MKLVVCKDETHWVETVNSVLDEKIKKYSASSMYIPAGETPIPLYCHWNEKAPPFLKDLTLVQIDEIISDESRGVFQGFIREHLPRYVNQVEWIEEADRIAEIGLLGLGLNGHVAFHEPSVPEDFFSGCLILDSMTTTRLKLENPTRAVTYGLGAFMRVKGLMMLVRGASKKKLLRQIVQDKIPVPATALLEHPDFTIITDFQLD